MTQSAIIPEVPGAVATLDVFETVLVRTVSPPDAIFSWVGEEAVRSGAISCSPYVFEKARKRAGQAAARRHEGSGSLDAIYDEVQRALGLTDDARGAIQAIELAVEERSLVVAPGARSFVETIRKRYENVVYLSDMYLGSEFIQRALRVSGLWENGDVILVSGEQGATKITGKLFLRYGDTHNVPLKCIDHYGNSQKADVVGAGKAGVRGIYVGHGNSNRYERALEGHRTSTDGWAAVFSGASRLSRMASPADARSRVIADVAAGVAGPVLVAFVLWVLRRAEVHGLQRLYFAARDGQILVPIAERLARALDLPIEIRYVYASRSAWTAALSRDEREAIGAEGRPYPYAHDLLTNRQLALRTGLSEREVDELVRTLGGDESAWESKLDRAVLKRALEEADRLGLYDRNTECLRALLRAYLMQEGLLTDAATGFVDIGWRGTLHEILVRVQEEAGGAPSRSLMFGHSAAAGRGAGASRREAYLFDQTLPGITPPVDGITRLMELFCQADHGTLLGYESHEGTVSPLLCESGGTEQVEWGLLLVQQTVWRFADHVADHLEQRREGRAGALPREVDLRTSVIAPLRLFWESPTSEEVDVWGLFPWEEHDGSHSVYAPYVPRHSVGIVFDRLRTDPELIRTPRLLVSPRPVHWPAARGRRDTIAWRLFFERRFVFNLLRRNLRGAVRFVARAGRGPGFIGSGVRFLRRTLRA